MPTARVDPPRRHRFRRLHRLGRGRPCGAARRGGPFHRAPASSSAARTRPMCAPTRISTTRSRTWSTAPSSIPASRCCGIERIYVHESFYDAFVKGFAELTYALRARRPARRGHDAGADGAHRRRGFRARARSPKPSRGRQRADRSQAFPRRQPARLISRRRCWSDVDHAMRVMTEESFGPVIGIMKVEDRRRGGRADERQPLRPHRRDLDAGREPPPSASATASRPAPWFMNRCDYLDPAWPGPASRIRAAAARCRSWAFEYLTRPKSFHLRIALS